MSKQSEAVKAWRIRFRERIRASLGGKCVCCGYDRYGGALEMHHLDPTEKEFTFGEVRAHPIALAKLRGELSKCVLVCRNCHLEIHHNGLQCQTSSSFDAGAFDHMLSLLGKERLAGKFKKKPIGEVV